MTSELTMAINAGTAFDGYDFTVEVPRELVADLLKEVRTAGHEAEEPLVHSSGGDRVTVGVSLVTAAGGLVGVAKVMHEYFARNNGKHVVVDKDNKIDAKGYSARDFEKILRAVRGEPRPSDEE